MIVSASERRDPGPHAELADADPLFRRRTGAMAVGSNDGRSSPGQATDSDWLT